MSIIWNDVRYALRQLRKSPGFTLTAVLTLTLGIGVNAAIFTVFNKVLLHTLPVHNPGELVLLEEHSKYETGSLSSVGGGDAIYFSYPAYQRLRDNNHVLDGLAGGVLESANIATDKDADRVNIQLVTGNYFSVVGVHPVLGRLLAPADDTYHAGNPVAVLNEDYWKGHFGSDPAILNKAIQVNGVQITIIGVVRHSGLWDGVDPALFIPMALEQQVTQRPGDRLADPLFRWMVLVGRLRQGVTQSQAEIQLNTLWWNWRRDVLKQESHSIPAWKSDEWLKTHLSVKRGSSRVQTLVEFIGNPLKALWGMALIVLLIACVNVANLLLVRAAKKQAELAVRGALGASRARIFQQVIAEGLVLGLSGAITGFVFGCLTLMLLVKSIPQSNWLHDIFQASVDWKVLLFCAGTGIITSVLFSFAPAFLSTRINLLRALHGQSGTVTSSGSWLRSLLVSGEIALSLMLMTGTTVLGWSLYQLRSVNPGFATDVLTFRAYASTGKDQLQRNEYEAIREGVLHQPGVQNVVYAANGLLTGEESGNSITVSGHTNRGNEPVPDDDWVSPGFFSAMQIPLLAGREFTEQDTPTSQKVAIVDQTFVDHYFGGDIQKALRSQFGFGGGTVKTDIQIVGVVPAIHTKKLSQLSCLSLMYFPYAQASGFHHACYYVRVHSAPSQFAGAIRSLLHRIDRNLPIPDVETMQDHLKGAIFQTQMMTALASVMGGLALVLAAVGLYGVLAFVVAQRTREIGIRMALGANRADVSSMVLKQMGILVAIGLAAGVALAWGGLRFLRSGDTDLHAAPFWLYGLAGCMLVIVMLAAGLLPARRAASVDPMQALRME
jgi:putative ABC transport system permease protein